MFYRPDLYLLVGEGKVIENPELTFTSTTPKCVGLPSFTYMSSLQNSAHKRSRSPNRLHRRISSTEILLYDVKKRIVKL
jgi:hypothetical protein